MSRKIRITGTIEMSFDQEIEVTDEQFELLKDLDCEDVYYHNNSERYHEIEGLIDMGDMLDIGDAFENVMVEEIKKS
jgi:hypothetical protein